MKIENLPFVGLRDEDVVRDVAEYYGYTFKLTCRMCPEQYDVYKDDNYVAYIRKRWGHLTAYYVDDEGEIIWDNPFYVAEEGGSYSGTIKNRDVHFKAITKEITEHLKEKNNGDQGDNRKKAKSRRTKKA